MKAHKLTDKSVERLPVPRVDAEDGRRAELAARYEVADVVVPSLIVRVYPSGKKVFMLRTRFPNKDNPERRWLGDVGVLAVDGARDKARDWLGLISKGIDPADVERREKEEERKRVLDEKRVASHTVGAVYDSYCDWPKFKNLRTARVTARRLKNSVVDDGENWRELPIGSIGEPELADLFKKHHNSYGNNLYDDLRGLFKYAHRIMKAIPRSPFADVVRSDFLPDRKRRDRILSDAELIAYWRAADKMTAPWNQLYKFIALTALRRDEAAGLQEHEIENGWITVPAERMKGTNTRAQDFEVAVTPDIKAVLATLPKYESGPYLFTTDYSFGVKPCGGFGEAAARHKDLMTAELKKLGVTKMAPWHFHDVRRTVRSKLSKLKVPFEIRELVLAHVPKGIVGTYDLHDFRDEKRAALMKWHKHLRELLDEEGKTSKAKRRAA
jgi:hypothetical protein